MGRRKNTGVVFSGFLILTISFLGLWLFSTGVTDSRARLQKELASSLGVSINSYPYPKIFPVGYFETVLKPEMTVLEVHNVVQGYEKVLKCDDVGEIYYYFSTDDKNAIRFKIYYNSAIRFEKLVGEEPGSPTIHTSGCRPGYYDE